MPEISIIIPCHNVEEYVMRCFDSLKQQTIALSNLELIFVDDASTDHTWEVLQEIERLAPEQTCIIHLDENMRQGGARNVGLSYATGTYIGYVDSDDWVEPDMYETLYRRITEDGSDLAFCRHFRDDGQHTPSLSGNGAEDAVISVETPLQRTQFILSGVIGFNVWDKLYRKDFLLDNQIFFPQHLAYEDIFFGSLVYLYARKVSITERKLYHYFINPGSTVLERNCAYHQDIFQVNYLKWDCYASRGFLDENSPYRDVLCFDFLLTFYLSGFKTICLRYDVFPFDMFCELKKETLKRVPHYRENPFFETHLTELQKLVMMLLDHAVTPAELSAVQMAICKYYGLTRREMPS